MTPDELQKATRRASVLAHALDEIVVAMAAEIERLRGEVERLTRGGEQEERKAP